MVVIPKSVSPKRIAENIKATQIQLNAEDIKRIEAIDKPGARMFRVCIVIALNIWEFAPNVIILCHAVWIHTEGGNNLARSLGWRRRCQIWLSLIEKGCLYIDINYNIIIIIIIISSVLVVFNMHSINAITWIILLIPGHYWAAQFVESTIERLWGSEIKHTLWQCHYVWTKLRNLMAGIVDGVHLTWNLEAVLSAVKFIPVINVIVIGSQCQTPSA